METIFTDDNKLSKLASDAAQAEQNAPKFMEPVPPTIKKGRGRPPLSEAEKKAKAEQQKLSASKDPRQPPSDQPLSSPTSISNKQIAKPFTSFISNTAVNYVGDPRAAMTPTEQDDIAEGIGLLMDKYMPLVVNQYGAEAMFCMAMGTYTMRIIAMKKVLEMEKRERQEKFKTAQADQTNAQTN